jgi:hypothetical protein
MSYQPCEDGCAMITKFLFQILSAIQSRHPRSRSGSPFQQQMQFPFMREKQRAFSAACRRASLVSATLFLSACTSVKFDVAEGDASKVAYVQGNPVVPSKNKTTVFVSFSPEAFPANQRGCLNVTLANTSKTPMNFGPENITVSCEGKALKTFSYEALKREIQQRAAAAAIAMGMAGAMQTAAASMPATTTTYGTSYGYGNFSGTANPAYGYNPWRYSGNFNSFGSYSATSTTYNPAAMVSAQAAVNANTLQQMNAITANRNASLADLESMLRTTTVPPGAAFGGNIVFKLPPTPGKIPKEILVTVQTPVDAHQIKVAYRKR